MKKLICVFVLCCTSPIHAGHICNWPVCRLLEKTVTTTVETTRAVGHWTTLGLKAGHGSYGFYGAQRRQTRRAVRQGARQINYGSHGG